MDYRNCTLCPRRCGADRTSGGTGFCRMSDKAVIARAARHDWEEPVISGERGSGAVFFSGCTLGCAFCQNTEISHDLRGRPVTALQLRKIFEELVEQGCHNINLVTPTHFLPTIVQALTPKLPVPVVYNCGGYERVETLKRLEGLVDVYLPDLKYSDAALAKRLSGAADYVDVAQAAIREMFRQTGPILYNKEGMLEKGVLVRHLILPGQVGNSLGVLDWLAENFQKGDILISLMSQYVPYGRAAAMEGLNRRITQEEYDGVLSYMELLGLDEGFTQEFSSAQTCYIPQWEG